MVHTLRHFVPELPTIVLFFADLTRTWLFSDDEGSPSINLVSPRYLGNFRVAGGVAETRPGYYVPPQSWCATHLITVLIFSLPGIFVADLLKL